MGFGATAAIEILTLRRYLPIRMKLSRKNTYGSLMQARKKNYVKAVNDGLLKVFF